MKLKQGTQLQGGRYRIEKVLGQGGFGITYLGVQTSLDDKVAIKEFFMKDLCNRDANTSNVSVGSVGSRELVDGFRNKFIKEARNIRKLKHNNIVSIIDVFEENGTAYYVMEYLPGGNLKTMVDENGALDENTAIAYIRDLAKALNEVHSNGLLHLDVKPANVMINRCGKAVLIDFGISKHYDECGAQTSSGLIGTSEGYAPLEQYEAASLKTFTPATDVYALGATLFFLLMGERPPKASDVMNLGLPIMSSNISSRVSEAIHLAMNPVVRQRPQSIDEFLSLLEGTGVKKDYSSDSNDKTQGYEGEETGVYNLTITEQVPEKPTNIIVASEYERKTKWMDFTEFKDLHKGVVAWMRFKMFLVVLFSVFLIYYLCKRTYLHVIKDIEDTSSRFKIVRSKRMRYGLTRWGYAGARSLIRMKYDRISRINDDTFICCRNGMYGIYNATKKKMVIPVKCESINVEEGKIIALKDGVVSIFNDRGYRVVENS